MVRITNGLNKKKNKKKNISLAKGFSHNNSKLARLMNEQIIQSLYTAYIGRKLKKRYYRRVWINRISTFSQIIKISYSKFIEVIHSANILFNRKILSYIFCYSI